MTTKERPILFSAPMVRAILEGRKTQTRRVLKPQPLNPVGPNHDGLWSDTKDPVTRYFGCSHGQPGDRLWVRETFAYEQGEFVSKNPKRARWALKADYDNYLGPLKWTPAIFMPRWASRLTLEIVSVRVERLQDISEEDAKAEGVEASKTVEMKDGSPCYSLPYQLLWNQINGCDAWEKNPWVWVIEFKRIKP